jgi:hypothetical protein
VFHVKHISILAGGGLRSAFLADQPGVQILVLTAHAIDAEVFFRELAGSSALPPSKTGIGQKPENCNREFVFVSCGDERSALLVDQLSVASNVVRNHG